jgi:RND family efflux transporter MFP subunit
MNSERTVKQKVYILLWEVTMTNQTFKGMVWLLGIFVGLTACKEKPEIVEVIRAIETVTVEEQAPRQIRKLSGIVDAVDSSDLSFEVGGQVDLVKVDIGDRVQKGQVLAVLDPEPYQLDVNAAQAELVKARANVVNTKAEFERQQRVYEQGAGAKSDLDTADYNYQAAQSAVNYQISRLNLAKRNLRKTTLRSPYEGTIAWRSVDPHEEVTIGQKVFEIDAKGTLEVQLAVPETTIYRIRLGDPATVTFPILPGVSANGRISDIGSAAVKANAFPVKVELVGAYEKVKPGMTAEVNLTVKDENRRPGYLVPLPAILPAPEENRGFVFVYDAGTSTVKKTPVSFRGTQQKKALVDEGLAAGDVIAIAGVSFLADGLEVKLMKGNGK